VLDGDVKIRQEGDTLIVPLAEEVLVVEKRVFVREEVRITRRREQVREPQQVPVRREDVVVERTEPRKHQ
jgi:stress response protein YsnF